MGKTISLGKLFGIQFRLHFSWFIIFALATISLVYPNYSQWLHWIIGIATSLLFFASVVAHELAHSLVGRAKGIPIDSITLFVFGGVSHMTKEVTNPGAEFKMAAAGPVSSLVIGGFFGLFLFIPGLPGPVSRMLFALMVTNWTLAVFNLIPGFPLDGGRVFRSALWHFSGSYIRSSRIAARVGQVIGYLLILTGILIVIIRPFNIAWFNGIWIVFIGWFLERVAFASYLQVRRQEAISDAVAAETMSPDGSALPPDETD